MEILGMDHVVLTTGDLAACLDFYGRVLGLTVRQENGRYSLHFSRQKINLHTRPAEFLPAAAHRSPKPAPFPASGFQPVFHIVLRAI